MKSAWEKKCRMARKYDATVDVYDGLYAEEQRRKYAVLEEVLVPRELHRVLDVGCGTGLLEEWLASKTRVLVGVDFSRRMLVRANERTRRFGNVELVQADSDYLPFRGGMFTCVLSFTLLQNLPRPSSTVDEMVRAAADGSAVVISALREGLSSEMLRNLLSTEDLQVLRVVEESVKDAVAICRKIG